MITTKKWRSLPTILIRYTVCKYVYIGLKHKTQGRLSCSIYCMLMFLCILCALYCVLWVRVYIVLELSTRTGALQISRSDQTLLAAGYCRYI